MVRRRNAPHRHAEREAHSDARQPGGVRRLARRDRRADDAVLRALRRAAGRSAEPVGDAALRGDGSRRRNLCARLGRRQGTGVHALQGDRGALEAERQASGQHQDHPRRRRRSRQCQPRQLHHRQQSRSQSRPRRDLRFRDVRARRPVDLLRPARARVLSDRSSRQQHRSAFGILRRRRGEPGVRAGADDRADEGSRRPHQDSRFL